MDKKTKPGRPVGDCICSEEWKSRHKEEVHAWYCPIHRLKKREEKKAENGGR